VLDFRYHALSLVAVFLALGIGILLGVTIGDRVLSNADRDLRSSLGEDLVASNAAAREASEQVDRRDLLIEEALPTLAEGRLRGRRVALMSVGPLPSEVESSVREAVELAGGTLDSVSKVETPAGPDDLALAMTGRPLPPGADGEMVRGLARRAVRAVLAGDRSARALTERAPAAFQGEYLGADALILSRSPPGPSGAAGGRREGFEQGMLEGLRAARARAVGVEAFEAAPSQVPFWQDRDIASVDDVDLAAGRLALVLALDGAQGNFGLKGTADGPIPELGG
jgi:hypothetical protein